MPRVGFESSVREGEDSSCLRPPGHCDRLITGLLNEKQSLDSKFPHLSESLSYFLEFYNTSEPTLQHSVCGLHDDKLLNSISATSVRSYYLTTLPIITTLLISMGIDI
jgi:hypothetical protein